MHYGNGIMSRCRDVLDEEFPYCSDLNTTQFLNTLILSENPDFIAFTGMYISLYLILVPNVV